MDRGLHADRMALRWMEDVRLSLAIVKPVAMNRPAVRAMAHVAKPEADSDHSTENVLSRDIFFFVSNDRILYDASTNYASHYPASSHQTRSKADCV